MALLMMLSFSNSNNTKSSMLFNLMKWWLGNVQLIVFEVYKKKNNSILSMPTNMSVQFLTAGNP